MRRNRKQFIDNSECVAVPAELTTVADSTAQRIVPKISGFGRLNSAADRLERTERLLLCALRVWEHNNLKR